MILLKLPETTYLQSKWMLASKSSKYRYIVFIECMLNTNKLFKKVFDIYDLNVI